MNRLTVSTLSAFAVAAAGAASAAAQPLVPGHDPSSLRPHEDPLLHSAGNSSSNSSSNNGRTFHSQRWSGRGRSYYDHHHQYGAPYPYWRGDRWNSSSNTSSNTSSNSSSRRRYRGHW